ncbi:cortexin-1 isoform 1-T1 [Thomomys bottae]
MSATWTLSPEPLPPSTGPPVGAGLDAEQRTVFAFVLCLLVVLVLLMVRCVRILLDPYSRMPASSWTDHKEALERGQFDYALVEHRKLVMPSNPEDTRRPTVVAESWMHGAFRRGRAWVGLSPTPSPQPSPVPSTGQSPSLLPTCTTPSALLPPLPALHATPHTFLLCLFTPPCL